MSVQGLATREAAESALRMLTGSGISDVYLMPGSDPPKVLSLGVFSDYQRAQRRVGEVRALGLTARIDDRKRAGLRVLDRRGPAGARSGPRQQYFSIRSAQDHAPGDALLPQSTYMDLCHANGLRPGSCLTYPVASLGSVEDLPLRAYEKARFIFAAQLTRSRTLRVLSKAYERVLRQPLGRHGMHLPSWWVESPSFGPLPVPVVIEQLTRDILTHPRGHAFFRALDGAALSLCVWRALRAAAVSRGLADQSHRAHRFTRLQHGKQPCAEVPALHGPGALRAQHAR